jgi:hypothetical protein
LFNCVPVEAMETTIANTMHMHMSAYSTAVAPDRDAANRQMIVLMRGSLPGRARPRRAGLFEAAI